MTDPNAPDQPGSGAPTPPPPAYGQPAQPGYAQPAQPGYGQPGHGQPAYGAPAYGGAPARKTNVLAIVSLIASISGFVILPFVGSVVGVICGHISLSQIKKTGEDGRGLGLAGLIVGYIGVALSIIGTIAVIAWVAWFTANYGTGDIPTY